MAQSPALKKPPQHQDQQPGVESEMRPKPISEDPTYRPSGKLEKKTVLITGGDSGIGKAVAILCAKEGADVCIVYLNEHHDAEETRQRIEELGRRCLLIAGDVGNPTFCRFAIGETVKELGQLDVLVNNAAEQHPTEDIEKISPEQLERTFRTNIFSYFYMVQAALQHLGNGSTVINSTSVTAYKGSSHLMDYSATKGAIVAFTRSLSQALLKKKIRVNAVAPGPVWTPLIPASFKKEEVAEFGKNYPMGRPAHPYEIAPSYIFLACNDSVFMTGQVLHPNGGKIVNS